MSSLDTNHIDTNNKENQMVFPLPIINQQAELNTNRKSLTNNDDEMQRIVAYMNQFEKENISNAIVNSPEQLQPVLDPSLDEPSKLRLSSSSLSSCGAESLTNNEIPHSAQANSEEYEDIGVNKFYESTATIKINSNELDTMVVTTQNLNSILSPTSQIDRRTYIINKIYDNLEDEGAGQEDSDDRLG